MGQVLPGQGRVMGSNMGESAHIVHCAGFWDALVLKDILEEHGVQVPLPQENVFLTLRASGPLDAINAAVAELIGKYQSSWPVTVDGIEPVPAPVRPGAIAGHPPAADPPPSPASRQCVATTARRSRCKLPAAPGGTTCAIHASQAQLSSSKRCGPASANSIGP